MIELHVTGMTCSGCVAAVRRAVERVVTNSTVEIELSTGRLRLNVPSELRDTLGQRLVQAIENAGFGAGLIG